MLHRRSFLLGLGAAVAAPAIIIRPGFLMPVKQMLPDGVALRSMAHPSGPIPVSVLRQLLLPGLMQVAAQYRMLPDAAMLRLIEPHDRVYGVVAETKAGFYAGDVVTLRDFHEPSSGPS